MDAAAPNADSNAALEFLLGLSENPAPLVLALRAAATAGGALDPEIAAALADALDPAAAAPLSLRRVLHRRGRPNSGIRRARVRDALAIARARETEGDPREAAVAAATLATGLSRAAIFRALAEERKLAALADGVRQAIQLSLAEAVLAVVRDLGPGAVPHLAAAGLWPPNIPPPPNDPLAVAAADSALSHLARARPAAAD